jgi:hypothetical protein
MDTNYLKYGKKYPFLLNNPANLRGTQHDCGCSSNKRAAANMGLGITDPIGSNSAERTLLYCVTTSCCSLGIFSIEVWKQTTCHYVSSNRVSVEFHPPVSQPDVEVYEDLLLAGVMNSRGEGLILPKGRYRVEGNQINFTPQTYKAARTYCYHIESEGTILGHSYSINRKWCITFGKDARTGVVEIDTDLPTDVLQKLRTSNADDRYMNFSRDTRICDKGTVDFNLPAGKYFVNDDGIIYLQNVTLLS